MWLKESDGSQEIEIQVMKRNVVSALLALSLLVILSATVFFSTKEETRVSSSEKIISEKIERRGIDCADSAQNPLRTGKDAAVDKLAASYYAKAAEKSKFAESYQNLRVHTKLGPYEGSYIAFVEYDMKIKDIYTPVPGLGTIYLETDKSGKLHVAGEVKDEAVKSLISAAASHEDVQMLVASVQTRYEEALLSDSLLKDALDSLKQTYEQG